MADQERFFNEFDVVDVNCDDRAELHHQYLPATDILISQQLMDQDRLVLATRLRAIFNVETIFLPNIGYPECLKICNNRLPDCHRLRIVVPNPRQLRDFAVNQLTKPDLSLVTAQFKKIFAVLAY